MSTTKDELRQAKTSRNKSSQAKLTDRSVLGIFSDVFLGIVLLTSAAVLLQKVGRAHQKIK